MEMETLMVHIPKEEMESDDDSESAHADDPLSTLTIVEEDGSTSIVNNASVSTIISPHSQFSQQSGLTTYRVVVPDNSGNHPTTSSSGGVQVIQPTVNGQYIVIGGAQEFTTGRGTRAQIIDARNITRISTIGKQAGRDEKKRATHNEVERRRRDKINGWINKLAKIVPSASADDSTKQSQSKGGILAKACEYINELKSSNFRLVSTLKEHETTAEELDVLKREVLELRRENQMLKQQLGPTVDSRSESYYEKRKYSIINELLQVIS